MVSAGLQVTEAEKREALAAVLNSQTFGRSAQLRAFLSYVCEREIAGRTEDLTEYQIAVEVLGRPKDFNLTEDSSVRNRAYELRQRLEKYYSSEQPEPGVRIEIPRGGYVPYYIRRDAPAAAPAKPALTDHKRRWSVPLTLLVVGAAAVLLIGAALGFLLAQPRQPAVLREAWGPLAEPGDDLLISVATSLHMIVRQHISQHANRFPAPPELIQQYGATRPLDQNLPLYMEPAQLSVPLAELAATAALSNTRAAFGGSYQILPESEAPVAALRGRNAVLIGSGTNSQAALVLLRNLPWNLGYTGNDRFAVFDQRKPAGQNELYESQPTGQPKPSLLYGLLSVITTTNATGKARRTVVVSGSGSAGVQAAAEFFCSPVRLRELRSKFASGFPPTYQVVVAAKTSGLRLISYEYVNHIVPEGR
jgi:hypothetical protein